MRRRGLLAQAHVKLSHDAVGGHRLLVRAAAERDPDLDRKPVGVCGQQRAQLAGEDLELFSRAHDPEHMHLGRRGPIVQ
eukprot:3268392-Rhodomonas_salina.1